MNRKKPVIMELLLERGMVIEGNVRCRRISRKMSDVKQYAGSDTEIVVITMLEME